MWEKLFDEMVVLIGGALAASVVVVCASLQGMFFAGVMYFDTGYQPDLIGLVVPAFLFGGCCATFPIGALSGIVFMIFGIFGFRMDTTARGFERTFFIIWAIGILSSATFAALMMILLYMSDGSVAQNVLFCMAFGAGLATLAIDGMIIKRRHRWLKEWIVRFEASQQDAILNKNS